jgi:ethanolamine utilization protein EutQ (cupin superfamily)
MRYFCEVKYKRKKKKINVIHSPSSIFVNRWDASQWRGFIIGLVDLQNNNSVTQNISHIVNIRFSLILHYDHISSNGTN